MKLVKPLRFKQPVYVGDPINTIKLFNDKEAQEIIVLDIGASKKNKPIDFNYLQELASESFVPLSYGGGIKTIDDIKKVYNIGFEKVSINTSLYKNPKLVEQASNQFGAQSIVASVDYYINFWRKPTVYVNSLKKKVSLSLIDYCKKAEEYGAGELLLTAIDREGTYSGYDLEIIKEICSKVSVPVVANGGAKNLEDVRACLNYAGASAAAAGSLFVFYGSRNSVLINYPSETEIANLAK